MKLFDRFTHRGILCARGPRGISALVIGVFCGLGTARNSSAASGNESARHSESVSSSAHGFSLLRCGNDRRSFVRRLTSSGCSGSSFSASTALRASVFLLLLLLLRFLLLRRLLFHRLLSPKRKRFKAERLSRLEPKTFQ